LAREVEVDAADELGVGGAGRLVGGEVLSGADVLVDALVQRRGGRCGGGGRGGRQCEGGGSEQAAGDGRLQFRGEGGGGGGKPSYDSFTLSPRRGLCKRIVARIGSSSGGRTFALPARHACWRSGRGDRQVLAGQPEGRGARRVAGGVVMKWACRAVVLGAPG